MHLRLEIVVMNLFEKLSLISNQVKKKKKTYFNKYKMNFYMKMDKN